MKVIVWEGPGAPMARRPKSARLGVTVAPATLEAASIRTTRGTCGAPGRRTVTAASNESPPNIPPLSTITSSVAGVVPAFDESVTLGSSDSAVQSRAPPAGSYTSKLCAAGGDEGVPAKASSWWLTASSEGVPPASRTTSVEVAVASCPPGVETRSSISWVPTLKDWASTVPPAPRAPSRSEVHWYAVSGSAPWGESARPSSSTSCSTVTTLPSLGAAIVTTGALSGAARSPTSSAPRCRPSSATTRMVPPSEPASREASTDVLVPVTSPETGTHGASADDR